jgi:hypothetical protein
MMLSQSGYSIIPEQLDYINEAYLISCNRSIIDATSRNCHFTLVVPQSPRLTGSSSVLETNRNADAGRLRKMSTPRRSQDLDQHRASIILFRAMAPLLFHACHLKQNSH